MSIKTKKLFDQIHRTILTKSEDKVLKELSCYGDWHLGSNIRVAISTIAKNTKLHERTVYRAMRKIKELNILRRVRGHSMKRKRATEYMFNFQMIQGAIYASQPLFAQDRLKEHQRLLRKEDRRIERMKERLGINKFNSQAESMDNLKKYRENWKKTPGRMSENNRAIDIKNGVKIRSSGDNLPYRPPIRPPT